MTTVPSKARNAGAQQELALRIFVALGVATALVASALHVQANPVLGAFVLGLVAVAWQRRLLAWPTLLGYVLLVILFIPIRRYSIAAGLPVALEPYRLLIFAVLAAWALALVADPATRLARTGLEAPVALITFAILASLALNIPRLTSQGLGADVVKHVSFFASFLLVMFFTASAVTTRRGIDGLLKLLVGSGAVVAVLTIYEWRSGVNVFNQLGNWVPVLHLDPTAINTSDLVRGGRIRAYASAQHPIALGALLVMLLPLAVYLWRRTGNLAWMAMGGLLVAGALATTSRTAALMLVVLLVTFLMLKRAETVRLLPLLVPLLVCVQVAIPGTLGTFRAIILPDNGSVVSEQEGGAGTGTGRLQDVGPSLTEWGRTPLFGQGFGTRLPSEDDSVVNARILDDEWLGTLLEVGAVGFLAFLWLYVRAVRRLARRAREDTGSYGWLLTGLAAAITAFAVGMLTYDAFSFIQVTVLSFVLLGLGAAALRIGPEGENEDDRAA